MLINDNRILKNGDKIFKAPIIYSYLTNNNYYNNTIDVGISGTSIYNPINVYYKTPTGVLKQTKTTDSTNHKFTFPATNETSNKPYYFSGNVNGVYKLYFYNYSNSYYYRGDIIKFINQFPRLVIFDMFGYNSNFNQNLTNTTFPKTLKHFGVRDTSLSGDINTINGFENLEIVDLYGGNYSGSFSDSKFTKFQELYLYNLYSVTGNVKEIVDNNPNLYYWYIWNNTNMSGDVTDMDVSKLTYVNWYAAGNNNINGSMSGWTFNNNLTHFAIYLRNFGGDITNWDISNTKITSFNISNYNYSFNSLGGSMLTWVLPSTLTSFGIYGGSNMTSPPMDFSNCTNLSNISFNYCNNMVADINDINFGNMRGSITTYDTGIYGNLELFTPPTGVTSLQLRNSNFTGNISGITSAYSGITSLYLDGNNLSGDTTNVIIYDNWTTFDVGDNPNIYINLENSFYTNNLNIIELNRISGITGNWSNFVIEKTSISRMDLEYTPIYSDISNLEVEKINNFSAYNCDIVSDISSWYTGTSLTSIFEIHNNPNLSGDTTNWNVDNITQFYVNNTKLSGILTHNNVNQMRINSTDIESNIATDFNFSNLYWFECGFSNVYGHLSGVTLGFNFYLFRVYGCPNIYGTNELINYFFINRENWSRSGAQSSFYSIGDVATGSVEELGDMGSWSDSPWNITEAGVNNLVAGLDWTGSGTTVPWNSKQKIYWMKNRQISSTNATLKYMLRNFSYS